MAAKTSKAKRRKPAAAVSRAWLTMLAQNLTNMAIVTASSGSVLLCLLIAMRFA